MEASIKTILFDLDGTLVDSRADLAEAVNQALISVGRPRKSQDDIIPHVGNGLKALLANVLDGSNDQTLKKAMLAFQDYYDDHCVDRTVLYDDVKEGLRDLSRRVRFAVVTNKPYRFAEKIIKTLQISHFMAVLIGGDTVDEKKPHPAPLLEALKRAGGAKESALIVGDGAQDIRAGQAAGMKTCVAQYGYGFLQSTLDLSPDFTIRTFRELKEIIV